MFWFQFDSWASADPGPPPRGRKQLALGWAFRIQTIQPRTPSRHLPSRLSHSGPLASCPDPWARHHTPRDSPVLGGHGRDPARPLRPLSQTLSKGLAWSPAAGPAPCSLRSSAWHVPSSAGACEGDKLLPHGSHSLISVLYHIRFKQNPNFLKICRQRGCLGRTP